MLKLSLGFLVDTLFCVKWLARLSIFIHADIVVLVSKFVVVVILSEWWLFYLSGGRCRPLPTTVGTSLLWIVIKFPSLCIEMLGAKLPTFLLIKF